MGNASENSPAIGLKYQGDMATRKNDAIATVPTLSWSRCRSGSSGSIRGNVCVIVLTKTAQPTSTMARRSDAGSSDGLRYPMVGGARSSWGMRFPCPAQSIPEGGPAVAPLHGKIGHLISLWFQHDLDAPV